MIDRTGSPSSGRAFDALAAAYDRHRPAYPDVVIDHACAVAGLTDGAPVLEIGAGTGQLTGSLLARGLRVTAVEPGPRLLARARQRLSGAGEVEFIHADLERAKLPSDHYQAVFSASAIHWVDPDVGWRRIADGLIDGGTLALISYFGTEDPATHEDQAALRAALRRIAPGLADEWAAYRELDVIRRGVAQRRHNLSSAWAWLGGYAVGRDHVEALFGAADLVAVPLRAEHTAEELNALLSTMSFWQRLTPEQRNALAAENHAVHARLGRPVRSSMAACVLSAPRRPRP